MNPGPKAVHNFSSTQREIRNSKEVLETAPKLRIPFKIMIEKPWFLSVPSLGHRTELITASQFLSAENFPGKHPVC